MQRTRRAILDYLKRHPGATIEDLAQATGTATITARSHVAVLHQAGLVQWSDVRGRRGRPFRRYGLTEAAEEFFPTQYDQLAVNLLAGLGELEGQAGVVALITHVADQTAIGHLPRVAGRSLPERVAAVTSIIDEQGGAAEWEQTGEQFLIREHNCPYRSVSRQTEHVCELDRQVVARLAGAPVQVVQRLRDGAEACIFQIGGALTGPESEVPRRDGPLREP